MKNKNKRKVGRPSLPDKIKQEIIRLRKNHLSIREIQGSVFIWVDENTPKSISRGVVGKVVKQYGELLNSIQ